MPTVVRSDKDGVQSISPSQHQNAGPLALPARLSTPNQQIDLDSYRKLNNADVSRENAATTAAALSGQPIKKKPGRGRQPGKSEKWASHPTINRSNRRRSCTSLVPTATRTATSVPILTPPIHALSAKRPSPVSNQPPPTNSAFRPIIANARRDRTALSAQERT